MVSAAVGKQRTAAERTGANRFAATCASELPNTTPSARTGCAPRGRFSHPGGSSLRADDADEHTILPASRAPRKPVQTELIKDDVIANGRELPFDVFDAGIQFKFDAASRSAISLRSTRWERSSSTCRIR